MNETPPPSAGGTGDTPQRSMDRFFSWLRGLGIVRGGDRWFAGVAGGIAAKAGIDPLIVRGVFVVLALLGGPGVLLYLAAWLLLPDFNGRIHLEELLRGRASAGVIVTVVILGIFVAIPLLGALLPALFAGVWFDGGPWNSPIYPDWLHAVFSVIWFFVLLPALIVGVIVWIAHGRHRHGDHPNPGPGHQGRPAQWGRWGRWDGEQASGSGAPSSAAFATAASTVSDSDSGGANTSGDPLAGAEQTAAPDSAATPGDDPSGTPAPPWHHGAGRPRYWSDQMGDWSRSMREEAKQWNELGHRHHRDFKIGAAHVVITLALALLAAGIAAAWALGLAVNHDLVLTAALIAAVSVLAISVIVAGVRGRHTGFIGFLSFVGVIALIFAPFTSILPERTDFSPFGGLTVTAGAHDEDNGVVMLAGSTTLNLTELDRFSARRDIDVWLLAGNTTVELPADHPVEVEANLLAGGFTEVTGSRTVGQGGPFLSRTVNASATDLPDASISHVRVHVLAGTVRVVHEEFEQESAR